MSKRIANTPKPNMSASRQRGGQATARQTRKAPVNSAYVKKGSGAPKYKQQYCYTCQASHDYHGGK